MLFGIYPNSVIKQKMFRKILIATHGTKGAKKAEQVALEIASQQSSELFAMYVINSNWSSLTGIEWLNASHTRMKFYSHIEKDFYLKAKQILEDINRLASQKQVKINNIISVGIPEEAIIEECAKNHIDLLVLGSGVKGDRAEYKYTLQLKKIKNRVLCPILLA